MAAERSHLGKVRKGGDVIALNIIAYGFCGLVALLCLLLLSKHALPFHRQ